ncbi:MAG: hypothetical protein U0P45_02685 [Acidimicrobiales bacterium]
MPAGIPTSDATGDAGGLIVMVRNDPAEAARAIARDLRAELAIGGAATEQAVERLQARQLEHRDLEGLAQAMRRAEAVRDRTRAEASRQISDRLNTTVAIHPETLRRAANELLAAELALALALEQDDRRSVRGRRGRTAAATGSVATGAAAALLAAPPVGAAIVAAGLAATGVSRWRARRVQPAEHASLRSHCEVCRARWEQVAGVGADASKVEEIIHRYDPQDRVVGSLVGANPAVRAADRLAVERRLAWVSAWRREVGDATPIADPAIAELLRRDRTELRLTEGTSLAVQDVDTLVVAAPYADLPEARARELHRRLLGLPRAQRVIVVLPPDPEAPTGAQIPGIGWVPALTS